MVLGLISMSSINGSYAKSIISLSNDAADQHSLFTPGLNAGKGISRATAIYEPAGRPWNSASCPKSLEGVGWPALAYGLPSPSTIVPLAASYCNGNRMPSYVYGVNLSAGTPTPAYKNRIYSEISSTCPSEKPGPAIAVPLS